MVINQLSSETEFVKNLEIIREASWQQIEHLG